MKFETAKWHIAHVFLECLPMWVWKRLPSAIRTWANLNGYERTWRDVAVYHTYPMSREKCASCEKITGYFCSICENPVCLNCQQKHSDDHWSHPKPKQVVHLSEVANYPEGELQHLPEPRAGDVVASWSSSARGMKDFMNGIHDDRVHAMALGELANYRVVKWKFPMKRQPWYKRFWLAIKRLLTELMR